MYMGMLLSSKKESMSQIKGPDTDIERMIFTIN